MKKKYKWYQIVPLVLGVIVASPIFLFFGLCVGIQFLFTFPIEYPIYKKSKYRLVYKKKYKMGISRNWDFLFFEKLLDKGLTFYRSKNSYGYFCFYNDEYCFAHIDVCNIKLDDKNKVLIKESEKTPYIPVEELISKEKSYYIEAINRIFFLTLNVVDNRGEEKKIVSSFSDILRKNDVYLSSKEDEYSNLIFQIIKNYTTI